MDVHVTDFLTIGLLVLLEGLLSADNALVLAILVLGLPRSDQRKALRYGILGAFAFRILATLLAMHLLQVAWVKLIGACYLLYLTCEHFFHSGDSGRASNRQAGEALARTVRLLGDGRESRAHRHRVRRRLDPRRRGDVAEDVGHHQRRHPRHRRRCGW